MQQCVIVYNHRNEGGKQNESQQEVYRKVIANGSIDTKSYRYIVKELPDRQEVRRLPICCLDTTAAIDGWETVWVIR